MLFVIERDGFTAQELSEELRRMKFDVPKRELADRVCYINFKTVGEIYRLSVAYLYAVIEIQGKHVQIRDIDYSSN